MWERGWWTVCHVRGSPLRLHWSLPLSALLASRFRFAPGLRLGVLLLVLVHEMGHALLVRRYGLEVTSLDVHGLGGECRYEGETSAWQESVIAWGGVLAQAMLLPLGFFLTPHVGQPFVAELLSAFAWTNVWLIAVNLMPIPPLDGALAWRLPGLWRRSRRELRSYLRARDAMRAETRRAAGTHQEAEATLRRIERHDRAPTQLPKEIADQVEQAMQRALDEHRHRD